MHGARALLSWARLNITSYNSPRHRPFVLTAMTHISDFQMKLLNNMWPELRKTHSRGWFVWIHYENVSHSYQLDMTPGSCNSRLLLKFRCDLDQCWHDWVRGHEPWPSGSLPPGPEHWATASFQMVGNWEVWLWLKSLRVWLSDQVLMRVSSDQVIRVYQWQWIGPWHICI